jgi:hypothetical protein
MATLEELQAQRQRTIKEIQDRKKKGQKETPELSARLATVENQIRTMRGSTPAPEAGGPPAVGDPQTTQDFVNADAKIADYSAGKQLDYQNPDQINPFGTQTTTRDANGNIVVESKLSDGQQKIATQDEGLTQIGNDLAQARLQAGGFSSGFNPAVGQRAYNPQPGQFQNTGYDKLAIDPSLQQQFNPEARKSFGTGDLAADRTRIEDSVFKSLTRNLGRQKNEERDQLEQSLANRGIPIDPNDPQYARAMRDFNERYDTQNENAMTNAVLQGGQEYQTMFNVGEQGRTNDISQAQAIRGQNFNEYASRAGLQQVDNQNVFGNALSTQQQNANQYVNNANVQETQNANDFTQNQAVRNQNLNEIGALSGLGTGLQVPNFQPYQAPNFQVTPATTAATTAAGITQGAQTIGNQTRLTNAQIQEARANAMAAGLKGRGGSTQPTKPAGDGISFQ